MNRWILRHIKFIRGEFLERKVDEQITEQGFTNDRLSVANF